MSHKKFQEQADNNSESKTLITNAYRNLGDVLKLVNTDTVRVREQNINGRRLIVYDDDLYDEFTAVNPYNVRNDSLFLGEVFLPNVDTVVIDDSETHRLFKRSLYDQKTLAMKKALFIGQQNRAFMR
jgi:hypothetical protein